VLWDRTDVSGQVLPSPGDFRSQLEAHGRRGRCVPPPSGPAHPRGITRSGPGPGGCAGNALPLRFTVHCSPRPFHVPRDCTAGSLGEEAGGSGSPRARPDRLPVAAGRSTSPAGAPHFPVLPGAIRGALRWPVHGPDPSARRHPAIPPPRSGQSLLEESCGRLGCGLFSERA
jgi:hypothetical protein